MDYSPGARHPGGQRAARKSKRMNEQPPQYSGYGYSPPGAPPSSTNMFEDTSGHHTPQYGVGPPPEYSQQYMGAGYAPPGAQGFGGGTPLLGEPLVAGVAMQYGQHLMGQGRQFVDRELEKYVPVSRLKYYFAVDTTYVIRKLALLFFPFTHTDWSIKYNQEEPVQPRYEINAPDLYIPAMAYVTYVVVAGLVLGTQNRFTPEVLGIQASSALAWLVIEVLVELVTLYVTNIQTSLKTLDLVAFGCYKYVGIIIALLLSLVFHRLGYYAGLAYSSASLAFFMIRTLKIQVLPEGGQDEYSVTTRGPGSKRRLYLLLFIAGIQPPLMWWLSAHLVPPTPPAITKLVAS